MQVAYFAQTVDVGHIKRTIGLVVSLFLSQIGIWDELCGQFGHQNGSATVFFYRKLYLGGRDIVFLTKSVSGTMKTVRYVLFFNTKLYRGGTLCVFLVHNIVFGTILHVRCDDVQYIQHEVLYVVSLHYDSTLYKVQCTVLCTYVVLCTTYILCTSQRTKYTYVYFVLTTRRIGADSL